MKNDVIELLAVTEGQDVDGFPIQTEKATEVYGEIQTAKRTEFYQSASIGINVQYVCLVNYDDYKIAYDGKVKPNYVRFEEERYKILKTYRKRSSKNIELTLVEAEYNG